MHRGERVSSTAEGNELDAIRFCRTARPKAVLDLGGAKTMKNMASRLIVCGVGLLVLPRAETPPIIPTETISSGSSSLVLKVGAKSAQR
jgi:hypothetical protein